MSLCPSCGKDLSVEESSAKFCTYCGAPLEKKEAEPTTEAPVTEEPVVAEETPVAAEAPTTEAPATEAPKQQNSLNVNVDEIKEKLNDAKEKALPFIDKIFEKLNTIPAISKILEKIDKKLYPALLAAPVALLVLILVIVIAVSSSGSYMAPMKDYMKLVNKQETDYVKLTASLSPDFRAKMLKDLYNTDIDDLQDSIESSNDSLEDLYEEIDDEFDKWKIGFDVKSKEKLSKKKVEDLQDEMDDYYDDYIKSMIDSLEDTLEDEDELEDCAEYFDLSEKETKAFIKDMIKYYESFEDVKITAVYEVKGKFTIKADKDEWESDTTRILFAKVNGDWVYAGLDSDDTISFDDDDEELQLFYRFFYLLRKNHLGVQFDM